MHYLKNRVSYATFIDSTSRLTISRGEVVAVKELSRKVKECLRVKGLLAVTEAEYLAYVASVSPTLETEPQPSSEPEALTPALPKEKLEHSEEALEEFVAVESEEVTEADALQFEDAQAETLTDKAANVLEKFKQRKKKK